MIVNDSKILIQQLKANKVGIIPTDTIYGLVTPINNESGLKKIYQLKNRSIIKKMPILVGSMKQLSELIIVDQKILRFLQTLKTPTTIIYVRRNEIFPHSKIWTEKTLAIRFVKWPWLQKILKKTGPIVATSCNLSGGKSITTWEEIIRWEEKVDFIFQKTSRQTKPSILYDWMSQKEIKRN